MDIPSSFTGGEEVCVWKNGDIRCVRRCIARQKFYAVLQKTSSGRAKVKIKSEITPPLAAFLSLRSTLWQNYSEESPKSLQARKAHYHALDTKSTEARKPFLPDLPSKIRGISLDNATHGGQHTEISPLPPVASPHFDFKITIFPVFSFSADGIFCLQVTIYWGQSEHFLGWKQSLLNKNHSRTAAKLSIFTLKALFPLSPNRELSGRQIAKRGVKQAFSDLGRFYKLACDVFATIVP